MIKSENNHINSYQLDLFIDVNPKRYYIRDDQHRVWNGTKFLEKIFKDVLYFSDRTQAEKEAKRLMASKKVKKLRVEMEVKV